MWRIGLLDTLVLMSIAATIPTNRRPLYAMYMADAISLAGNNLTTIAIPWFVLATTGSASKTGIAGFFAILPVIIASVLGGAVVDRLGYRRSSIIADLASGSTVAAIAILHSLDQLAFPTLLVLVFLGAFLDAPGSTARAALLPDLATTADIPMEKVSANVQIIERGSRLVSAPLAGVLIAAFGPVTALWVDAASFLASGIIVAVGIPAATRSETTGEPRDGYLRSLRAGFAFIRGDSLIKAILLTVMITNGLDVARSLVGIPVLARDVYESSVALGIMFAASGGGAVVGALLYTRFGLRYARRTVFIASFTLVGVPTLAFALLPPLWVAVVAQFLMGVAAGPLNPILMTVQFERIPDEMRARVFGAVTAGAFLAMPLGVLLGGVLIDAIGLRWSFAIFGLSYILTTASMIVNPAFRQMDKRRTQPALSAT
jgi:MFS family permease